MKSLLVAFLILTAFAAESQNLTGKWITSDKSSTYYFTLYRKKYVALKLPVKQKKISSENIFLYDLTYLPRKGVYTGKLMHWYFSNTRKAVLYFDWHNPDLLIVIIRSKRPITMALMRSHNNLDSGQ